MYIVNKLKYLFIYTYKLLFATTYFLLSNLKSIDEKKIVIVSSRSEKLEGNLKYVYDEIENQLDDVKIHFVYTQNKMNFNLFKELYILSNAKYIVLDDYYLPIYLIKPKKNIKIIQLWHAAGAFKKFGYSTVGTKFGPSENYLKIIPIHSNYTHVYVSSKNVVPYYAEAFNMSEENIFPLGIPRTDLFQKENIKQVKERIYHYFPILKKDTIQILIAPTYRAEGLQNESDYDFFQIVIDFIHCINENVQIIFKPHPYVNTEQLKTLKKHKQIFIAEEFSINEWMMIADAFITDYSSSIFEFSLLKRPFAHFVPDMDEYMKNRGFYKEIEQISDGVIIKEKLKLISWINEREKNEFFDTSKMIDANFDHLENVSKRIVSHFTS